MWNNTVFSQTQKLWHLKVYVYVEGRRWSKMTRGIEINNLARDASWKKWGEFETYDVTMIKVFMVCGTQQRPLTEAINSSVDVIVVCYPRHLEMKASVYGLIPILFVTMRSARTATEIAASCLHRKTRIACPHLHASPSARPFKKDDMSPGETVNWQTDTNSPQVSRLPPSLSSHTGGSILTVVRLDWL